MTGDNNLQQQAADEVKNTNDGKILKFAQILKFSEIRSCCKSTVARQAPGDA